MKFSRKSMLAVFSMCAVLLIPGVAAAQGGTSDSDSLKVFRLNGLNKGKPVHQEIKDLILPQSSGADVGEMKSTDIGAVNYDFTEPVTGDVSDRLHFNGFKIQFFSDVPVNLPTDVKPVDFTESTHGLTVDVPIVQFRMISSSTVEKKGATFSDELTITSTGFNKVYTINSNDDAKAEGVIKGTIPEQAIRFFEPDGSISDVVVIKPIAFSFQSDDKNPLPPDNNVVKIRSEDLRAKAFILKINSDGNLPGPIPEGGTLGTFALAAVCLGWNLLRKPGVSRRR